MVRRGDRQTVRRYAGKRVVWLLLAAMTGIAAAGTQRPLAPQGPTDPLRQYRLLLEMQLQMQRRQVDAIRRHLNLSEDDLSELADALKRTGGLFESRLPQHIRRLGLQHPEILEQAVRAQERRQILEGMRSTLEGLSRVLKSPSDRTAPRPAISGSPGSAPQRTEAAQDTAAPRDIHRSTRSEDSLHAAHRHAGRSNRPGRGTENTDGPNSDKPVGHPDGVSRQEDRRPGRSGQVEPNRQSDSAADRTDPVRPERTAADSLADTADTADSPAARSPAAGPPAPDSTSPFEGSLKTETRPDRSDGGRRLFGRTATPSPKGFDFRQELSQRGLLPALTGLVRKIREDARRQEEGRKDSEDVGRGIWSHILEEAAEHMRGDLADTVQRLQKWTQESMQTVRRSRENRTRRTGNPAVAGPTAERSVFGSDAAERFLPDTDALEAVTLGLLAAGLIAAAILMLPGRRTRRERAMSMHAFVPLSDNVPEIRSRQDIVRAFHWLTDSLGPDCPDWWHHRRAVRLATERLPEHTAELNELADLYEWARYTERHDRSDGKCQEDDSRIAQARHVLAGCLK